VLLTCVVIKTLCLLYKYLWKPRMLIECVVKLTQSFKTAYDFLLDFFFIAFFWFKTINPSAVVTVPASMGLFCNGTEQMSTIVASHTRLQEIYTRDLKSISPLALRWKCNSPRMGCVQRITPIYMWREKQ